jgi:nucleotide-binding universal stress UspA family protein
MPIVCGTDFSGSARPALAAAGALASRVAEPELWLVHVLDPATTSLDHSGRDAVEKSAAKRLQEEVDFLRRHTKAHVHSVVLGGTAGESLLEFAKIKRARVLVVASQGHAKSPLFRVGGTSERLAESSEVPVLVIRDAAPFEAWARDDRPLRVLLAVDWSRNCEPAIRWLEALRVLGPCDVVVGHVYHSASSDDVARRYGLPWPHTLVDPMPEAERLLERDLASRVGVLPGAGQVSFRAKHGIGRLGDYLLELAEEEKADVIVMGSHQRRGLARLGSAASVVLRYSHSSVAIVPVAGDALHASDEVPCIRRVLVPTDLSVESSHAVPFGYSLLGGRGGEVHLLHVLSAPREGAAERDIAAELRALVPRRGVPLGAVTRTEVVVHPSPARAICEASERLGVDAICISSNGRGGLTHAILGSVSEAVMRESKRPVYFVRPLPP